MYGAIINSRPAFGGHVRVHSVSDIEYLVKESEVITGQPGRKFVIFGAERLAYRIQWHPSGYRVQRLDQSDNPTSNLYMLPEMFEKHCVGEALREGCLFTSLLQK